MNDRQLKSFVAIAQCGSFTKAEGILYVSKQALRKQMESLEREIGVPLFIRGSQGLLLTTAGKEFLDGAKQILSVLDNRIERCRAAASEDTLRLAVYSDILATFIVELGSFFLGCYPEFKLRYEKVHTRDWLEAVQSGKASSCLYPADEEVQRRGLCYSLITKQPVYCLMSRDNPLAANTVISPANLTGYEVYLGRRHWYEEILTELESLCGGVTVWELYTPLKPGSKENGSGTDIEELTYSFSSISQICFSGGVCILSKKTTTYFPQLIAIPLDVQSEFSFGLAYRPNPPVAVLKFIEATERFYSGGG